MTATDRVDLGLKDVSGCSCCAISTPAPALEQAAGSQRTEIFVEGMTCSHCIASVTQELSALDGVHEVGVELNPSGASTVIILSIEKLDADRVRAAIDEAGYSLVGSDA